MKFDWFLLLNCMRDKNLSTYENKWGTKLEKIYANARKILQIKESKRKYSNLIIDINL